MPPHFALTQEATPDFSEWKETPFANHGFHTHLISEDKLRKNMAVYYGMISFMDAQIGRILDRLDALGIADNTLVVFSTDHGHFLGQHGLTAKGAFHYEDLLKLPFIARWPHKIPASSVNDSLQSLIDLSPTFLTAAGLPVPGVMQGKSQLDVWKGKSDSARDVVITEFRHQPTKVHLRTFVDARYKITLYRGHAYGELFDLQEDPEERNNLWDSAEHAEIKAALLHQSLNAEMVRDRRMFAHIVQPFYQPGQQGFGVGCVSELQIDIVAQRLAIKIHRRRSGQILSYQHLRIIEANNKLIFDQPTDHAAVYQNGEPAKHLLFRQKIMWIQRQAGGRCAQGFSGLFIVGHMVVSSTGIQ